MFSKGSFRIPADFFKALKQNTIFAILHHGRHMMWQTTESST